ncbi:unnamed protein product [Zymoseptoria tritici ST99CH_3D7]|uniref:JmjC domain-containing protein n=1 Tax=Zymoseptoria tritici (strain ST99CH_3D7) TaxID=1276538 RepID=A0A1X7RQ04_ZYMT9|nr:unnamed protein product [Zymoseptoria tritici ST99CH_3D7]
MAMPLEPMDLDDDDDESSPSSPGQIGTCPERFLQEQLTRPHPGDDPILRCGNALLSALAIRPREVLREAHRMLYSRKADEVDVCWLRLFEEVSLHVVFCLLPSQPPSADEDALKIWLAEVIAVLDRAIIIAGAPARREVINVLLEELEPIAQQCNSNAKPQLFHVGPPPALQTSSPIARTRKSFDRDGFFEYLTTCQPPHPIIIPDLLSDWPALHLWRDLGYLHHRTMGGLRLVPIEIGSSYTSQDWSQKIVTFGQFADTYLGPLESHARDSGHVPKEVAYLAQHDLFAHIPSLARDIMSPSLLTVSPPPSIGAALQTPGLATSLPHHGEAPRMNAWLGPAGTKTPLHTDPWHNLFCQVVGWKYIRLYPPEERERLYPRGKDGMGVDGSNTSGIDVQLLRPAIGKHEVRAEDFKQARKSHEVEFPHAEEARYVEAMLGPGDSLYVPLGWWHYVESATTSFSVSFWWI